MGSSCNRFKPAYLLNAVSNNHQVRFAIARAYDGFSYSFKTRKQDKVLGLFARQRNWQIAVVLSPSLEGYPERSEGDRRSAASHTQCGTLIAPGWLDSSGRSIGVQQKLVRQADISTTKNIYGDAATEDVEQARWRSFAWPYRD